jgi:tetratricopeptide (TPR) repeat protein
LAAPPASQFAARFERARQALLTLLDAAAIAEAGGASASWQERFDAALALRPQDRFLQFAAQATDEHLAARTQQAEAQRSVEGWLDLARRWELRARPENVEVALRQALALAPDEPRTLIALGKQLYDRGRFDEAAPYLNRAAERLPSGHPLATSLRAMVQRGAR